MTLDELRAFDISMTWARLKPDIQTSIGEAVLAWQLAQLASDLPSVADDRREAQAMADEARVAVAEAVAIALPEFGWDAVPTA